MLLYIVALSQTKIFITEGASHILTTDLQATFSLKILWELHYRTNIVPLTEGGAGGY